MSKLLVVYCSMTGNTKAAAEAIAEGAKEAGAQVTLKIGTEAQPLSVRRGAFLELRMTFFASFRSGLLTHGSANSHTNEHGGAAP